MNYLIISMNILLFFMSVPTNIYEPSNNKDEGSNNFYVVATNHQKNDVIINS